MKLLATGFNAHAQLDDRSEDLYYFTTITDEAEEINLLTWSTCTWTSRERTITRGHQQLTNEIKASSRCYVGDHNGLLGLLADGRLWCLQDGQDGSLRLIDVSTPQSPLLTHLATASNGRTVVAYQRSSLDAESSAGIGQAPREMLIDEFCSFSLLRQWYTRPSSSEVQPHFQHIFDKPILQVVAGSTSFALLTADGSVYTWGEARRSSLGRDIVDESGKSTAHLPGLVTALEGLRVKKICHGGWLFGAVTDDGAAYLWGLGMPQEACALSTLSQKPAEEDVALVVLTHDDAEEPDVIDMDIGDGHVAIVTSVGRLYVAGDNSNGQLGLPIDTKASADWIFVPDLTLVRHVVCGPLATAVLTD